MESVDAAVCFMDDLLDFASDLEDESLDSKAVFPSLTPPLPEFAEEELEWLSNKDAFPTVDTFVDILSEHPGSLPKQRSPVSVLENSSTSSGSNGSVGMDYCRSLQVPVKARSKQHRRRRRDIQAQQCWWSQENMEKVKATTVIGRKCQHCGAEKTPQWRAGPSGPKTLCNACGVRYKSGRLVPEYRPASSPSFSSELHSNSHRKVLEMRKQKQMMGFQVVKPMEKG